MNSILRQIQREFRQGYHDALMLKLPPHLENWETVILEDQAARKARAEAMGMNVVEEVSTAEALAKQAEEEKKRSCCTWQYKDDQTNRRYTCTNPRFVHPTHWVIDQYGVRVRDVLKVCAWHANNCAGDHGVRIRSIAVPNAMALCTSCYATPRGRKRREEPPPALPVGVWSVGER